MGRKIHSAHSVPHNVIHIQNYGEGDRVRKREREICRRTKRGTELILKFLNDKQKNINTTLN